MKVFFGYDSGALSKGKEVPIIWDSLKTINGHILLVGKSGTGKTYTLKNIVTQLQQQSQGRLRVHVMDVHGDIDIEGSSTVKFSESTDYGFNPLAVNPDPDFGGVRKRIQTFLSALNRTSRQLGSKQEAALRNILLDLYAANGFYEKNPNSWHLNDGVERKYPKKFPTLEDALKFADFKRKSMFLGTSSKAVAQLELLNKKVKKVYSKQKSLHKSTSEREKEEAMLELKKLTEDAIDLYSNYAHSLQTGMELTDLIKYDSIEVMKSVVEKLENLNSIGIFKQTKPPFDPNATIWRYDIKALSLDEKKLFVSFVLEDIYHKSVQKGPQNDVRELIILDEAHNFFNDDGENITNIIAKEARKFGVGLFCASQSPTHFSDDFVSNVGSKIILGIDQMYWDGSVRKLKIEQQALEWIVPHQSLVMQINNKGELKSKFMWVRFKK